MALDGSEGGVALPDGGTPCRVTQSDPYLSSPYPGLHGNGTNSERIPCNGPETAMVPGWSALKDAVIFNPMTVSHDRIYAVVAKYSGCKLYTVTFDGREECFTKNVDDLSFGSLGSGPELDKDGNVYVSDGWGTTPDAIVSFNPDGTLRWRTTFQSVHAPGPNGFEAPLGLHFTKHGYVATVTRDGYVLLLDMKTGAIASSYSIPAKTDKADFAPLPGAAPITLPEGGLPAYINCRLNRVLGEGLSQAQLVSALAGGTGGSGNYTDNSVGIAGDLLFVVGGGPEQADGLADTGALVALKIERVSDTKANMNLAWYMETAGATGSSPTVDPNLKWVAVTDAVVPPGGSEPRARLVVADIAACADASTKTPPSCPPAWTHTLQGGGLNAHVSIDEDGAVYGWNQGASESGPDVPELVKVTRDGTSNLGKVLWSANFPASEAGFSCPVEGQLKSEWSSTTLILDNLVVGTVTHMCIPTLESKIALPAPIATKTQHELVAVRRSDGKLMWRNVSAKDDSINSPLMASDGNIYVPVLGMIDIAKLPSGKKVSDPVDCATFNAADTDFTGGILQFVRK